jgi:hypothetical protein
LECTPGPEQGREPATVTTAKDLWDRFVVQRDEVDKRGFTMVVLGYSFNLFADAVNSLDKVSPNAAALLCRATVESAGYLFLTRVRMPKSTAYKLEFPRDFAGRVRWVSFEEIISGLVARGVIEGELLKVANRIKDDGNFAAHLAARQDSAFDREFTVRAKATKEGGTIPFFGSRVMVTREEAAANVEGTGQILLALTRAVRKEMEMADPSAWN